MRKFNLLTPVRIERAARYAVCGLLALSVVAAAWRLWSDARAQPDIAAREPYPSGALPVRPHPDGNADIMHLFGVESPDAPPSAPDLDASVVGIVYASQAGASRAILTVNGTQQGYAVGATLPNGGRIVGIDAARVLLATGGVQRALFLEHKLADQNADFSLPVPVTADMSHGDPAQPASLMSQHGDAAELQTFRQNLITPPDPLTGKNVGAATRLRATHRGRVTRKTD